MLPWFADNRFPLYLAPMAGVTDLVFRRLCKELGADVMLTEFVSAEGIIRRDDRTRQYTEFEDEQRMDGLSRKCCCNTFYVLIFLVLKRVTAITQ